ncbi:hypothetical protein GUJ93_ZPchr0002g23664 [Zizania palustris]|uniref:Uncharacterized protein n=1 Tax=Zizania palustris TaxID=103762 RepID=A0A8J5S160_ZIZPA|nr:hypothetical protein GUJ93_ZPchr0002g23664 [Zizania palustris]
MSVASLSFAPFFSPVRPDLHLHLRVERSDGAGGLERRGEGKLCAVQGPFFSEFDLNQRERQVMSEGTPGAATTTVSAGDFLTEPSRQSALEVLTGADVA